LAENTTASSARRKLSWLSGIAVFFVGLMVWGVATAQPGASYSPELALDLQGGTQIILTPTVAEGEQASAEQLNQAVTIIRQRIDGSGVGEAQVSIQGNQNIVVAIPGTPDATTLQLIRASALLEFRPVIEQGISQPAAEGTAPVDLDALSNELTAEPANASDPAWITERIRAELTTSIAVFHSAMPVK